MFKLILSLIFLISFCQLTYAANMLNMNQNKEWKLNTSNPGKLGEFQRLFKKYDIDLLNSDVDLKEIEADPITVIAHKASQLDEMILIEDTSLDIEGANVGINIRWVIDHLNDYVGRQATWTVLLSYRKGDEVIIYKGEVKGFIVPPRQDGGFGFDPVFLPLNSDQTLAEAKPDHVNARALAVEALINNNKFAIVKAIYDWDGPWQKDH